MFRDDRRGQSEAMSELWLIVLLIIFTTLIGAYVFADIPSANEQPPVVDFSANATATNVTIIHTGGDNVRLDVIDVVLRNDSTRRTYNPDQPTDLIDSNLDGDGRFEVGEWIRIDHSFPRQVEVIIIDRERNAILLQEQLYLP